MFLLLLVWVDLVENVDCSAVDGESDRIFSGSLTVAFGILVLSNEEFKLKGSSLL